MIYTNRLKSMKEFNTNPIWLQQLQTIYVVAHEKVQSNEISTTEWNQLVTRISKIQDQFNEM